MLRAILLFRRNRERILDLGAVYDLWMGQAPLLQKQLDEILRAQLVLTISAFDTFIHDCVRIGIVRKFLANGVINNNLSKYSIPFEDLLIINSLQSNNDKANYLDSVIKKINSKDSYQSPASVEFALGLLGIGNLWSKLSLTMGMPANDIKLELSNIVNRRNKIAHESDLNVLGVSLNPITKADVTRVLHFIYELALSIYKLLK